ncbi:sugar kinase [Paenibacillus sp. S150]|uniref:sugar kinase n=1 Tax=Paenibacillus sp. S150 TaxID=2749826 RepID=UPI001C58BBAD|nr:sugar kinase [Paenibacillus sp. S150]MBW4081511.1 sugar kinase [Paenibacillus sp. S150]
MSGTRSSENKIILIKRRTRLEELVVRYNTIQQAQFYIERLGADFSDYISEDLLYRKAVETAVIELGAAGRVQLLERQHVPNFIFGDQDTVVVLGQDGLVANTLKYLHGQPLIGVNPDPQRWDGVLLPFTVKDLRLVVPEVFRGQRRVREVTLAKAELNDGQSLYGVNDLFIGRKTHVSARYQVELNGVTEQQSSSGIIVSTGMGSTGWLKSVLAGAAGIARSAAQLQADAAAGGARGNAASAAGGAQAAAAAAGSATAAGRGGRPAVTGAAAGEVTGAPAGTYTAVQPTAAGVEQRLPWDHPNLYFTVREPFPSRTTSAGLVFGQIGVSRLLKITSQMPEDGVIFSDGVESDFLEFNSGVEATICLAEKRGRLVV